jgi:hypothetical protein
MQPTAAAAERIMLELQLACWVRAMLHTPACLAGAAGHRSHNTMKSRCLKTASAIDSLRMLTISRVAPLE